VGHWTSKCCKLEVNKCQNYGKVGHYARDCWAEKKEKDRDQGKKKGEKGKRGKRQKNQI
jgi:hypothetical protein